MGKYLKNHAKKNILTIIQSGLVIILIVLVMLMMVQIRNLQGTARVLNYAGLVRGATQREVKLEITGTESDELTQYLDDIQSGLKYQDDHYQTDRRGVKNVLQTLFDAADKYMYTNKQREKLGRQD